MALKIIKCPWCGKEARITYEENRVYQMKCYSCRNTMLHVDHSFDSAVDFFEHHANLLQAEQDGRLVVLPFIQHSTMLNLSDPENLEVMEDVRLYVAWKSPSGIVFHSPYSIFLQNIEKGYADLVQQATYRFQRVQNVGKWYFASDCPICDAGN